MIPQGCCGIQASLPCPAVPPLSGGTRNGRLAAADGVLNGSEHVIIPQSGDQAAAGGRALRAVELQPRHGNVDAAPAQVRDELLEDAGIR